MITLDVYNSNLSKYYLKVIPSFFPQYSEMVRQLAGVAVSLKAKNALEIACGPGYTADLILRQDRNIHLTCIDILDDMVTAAKISLLKHIQEKRATVSKGNFRVFTHPTPFDFIFSSLFLINFPTDMKIGFLKKIHSLLTEDGTFIWGDRISFKNKFLQNELKKQRQISARKNNGLDPEFIDYCFDHEEKDHPLTIPETIDLGNKSKFETECFWQAGGLALFFCCKKNLLS